MRSRQDSYDFAAVIRDTPDNQFEDTVRPLLDLDGFITGFAIDGITQTGLGETCDGPDCLPDCGGVAVCAEVPGTVGTIVACPQSRDIWQALEDCEMRGGTLAAPIDAAENSLIIATAFGVFDEGYWIGIHDSITEGTWQKIDGSPVTFTAWAPGRPNGGGGQNCAIIDNGLGGGWNDRACWERHGFICRVP